jgi:hypothetical protein
MTTRSTRKMMPVMEFPKFVAKSELKIQWDGSTGRRRAQIDKFAVCNRGEIFDCRALLDGPP